MTFIIFGGNWHGFYGQNDGLRFTKGLQVSLCIELSYDALYKLSLFPVVSKKDTPPMQINGRSMSFTVRVPLRVGKALLAAQQPELTYRQMAQEAIAEYARKLANSQDTEKAA